MNCLFILKHKETGDISRIYAFRETGINTQFLVWFNNYFMWIDSVEFEPYDEEQLKEKE